MKNLIAHFAFCLLLLITAQTNGFAAGVLDRSFGTNGTATPPVGANPQPKKVKIQPDGKILVLGMVNNASFDTVLVRYNPNGSLDTGFGNNGIVVADLSPGTESANDLALQADGKIVVAGSIFSTVTQSVDFSIARFNQNGTPDASFGNNGVATLNQGSSDTLYALAIQTDGRIVAAGRTSDGDRAAVLRFQANGTLDTGFADNGQFLYTVSPFSLDDAFFAVALLPNGRILLGGTAWDGLGNDILALLEPNGSPAPDFGQNGFVLDLSDTSPGQAFELAILPDGKFLAVSRLSLRRILPNGALDRSFRYLYTHGGLETNAAGTDFVIRSDGRIIVLNQRRSGSVYDTVVYNNDGRDIHRIKNFRGADIAIQNDDKFVVLNAADNNFTLTRFISISSPGTRIADFDYDEKTDPAFTRLGQIVYVLRSAQNVVAYQLNRRAGEGVRFIPEDFYSNDPSQFPFFYWRFTTPNDPAFFEGVTENGNLTTIRWGTGGDIPVGGDYDGETRRFNSLFRKSTEPAIFRPSDGTWWVYNRLTDTHFAVQWGAAGDKPVPADYDYDGKTDLAVYRPSTGTWWVLRSSDNSYFALPFGSASDIPLTGDYDGDGKADFTVYRASEGNWYQYLTSEGYRVVRFGLSTDVPVPGDYDGDGKHDVAVFREGIWYILQSTEGLKVIQWGTATDSPVTVRYDQ